MVLLAPFLHYLNFQLAIRLDRLAFRPIEMRNGQYTGSRRHCHCQTSGLQNLTRKMNKKKLKTKSKIVNFTFFKLVKF